MKLNRINLFHFEYYFLLCIALHVRAFVFLMFFDVFLGRISIIFRWDLERVWNNFGISGKYTLLSCNTNYTG